MSSDTSWFIARWSGTRDSLTQIKTGPNRVYEFRTMDSKRILRITDDRHRTRRQVEAELDFVRFILSRGVPAARPQPSDHGSLVETLESNGRTSHCVVFEFLSGSHFRFFSPDIDRPLFHAWGSAVGALHSASRAFVPDVSRRRLSWAEQDTTRCDITRVSAAESAARREYASISCWLASLSMTPASWGLIHGDLERTNFVIDGSRVGLLDFDDACYHWYVADIANALWAFRGDTARSRRRFLTWFMEGYAEHCTLDLDVREHVSWFVRLRSLSRFAEILQASGASGSDARWLARERARMEAPYWW